MSNLFSKAGFSILFAILSICSMNASLMAGGGCGNSCECCDSCGCCDSYQCNRLYIGGFGGGVYSNSNRVSQYGTAFFSELDSIGPLPIIAEGHLKETSTGFGGGQIGYEWTRPLCSCWSIAPAVELEYFYFSHKKKGHLINQTVVGLPEHDFVDSFHMNSNFILANIMLAVNSDCLCGFSPYVGGGIGAARISLHKADSLQVEPQERGINHFNSNTNDSTWTFAAQAKAGLRYNFGQLFCFCHNLHIFAEYRYFYVDSSNFIFGSTNYKTHVPTSPWNVKVKNVSYNAFAVGVQFDI